MIGLTLGNRYKILENIASENTIIIEFIVAPNIHFSIFCLKYNRGVFYAENRKNSCF